MRKGQFHTAETKAKISATRLSRASYRRKRAYESAPSTRSHLLSYDPISSVQQWPGSLRRFGETQSGTPLYRIVFGPSRRYLNIQDWDGTGIMRGEWIKKYREFKPENIWIMERWRSAEDLGPGWDTEHLGPVGTGDYEICHAFEACGPADANLDKLVALIAHGRTIRLQDTMQWHRDDAAREKKATNALVSDMIRNKLPAFGCRPMFGRKTNRGTEKVHGRGILRYTAQEAGMPTTPGMRQVIPAA